MCVCVGFVMYRCFDNRVGVLVICVLVFTVFLLLRLGLFILICYWCKDCCHRVKTQLQ